MTPVLTSEGTHGRYDNLVSLGHAKFCVYARRRRHVSFIPEQIINRDYRGNRQKAKSVRERVTVRTKNGKRRVFSVLFSLSIFYK